MRRDESSLPVDRVVRALRYWTLCALFLAALALVGWLTTPQSEAGAPQKRALAPAATDTPTASPTACSCALDEYEPDNERTQARPIGLGFPQQHSFHVSGDIDYALFTGLVAKRTYLVKSYDLVGNADTYFVLYDQSGNVLDAHDDLDGPLCLVNTDYCASQIKWTAKAGVTYYLYVRAMRFENCACPTYKLRVDELAQWLPVALIQPTNTWTPTPTPTFTFTPSPTPTSTFTFTPSATPSATPTPTDGPSPTPTNTPADTGLQFPQAVAVDPARHVVFVASRDNDRVYKLDASTLAVLDTVVVPDQPWGIAHYAAGNKVYVGSWSSGTVTVLDASTLDALKTISVGPQPAWLEAGGNRIRLISYGGNALVTINPQTDTVERYHQLTRTNGAWGLAYNPTLDLTYVGSRDSKTITVIDAASVERTVVSAGRSVMCEPFEMDFNPTLNRLYTVCDVEGQLNDQVIVHQPSGANLAAVAEVTVGSAGPDTPAGEDGRGGIAANPVTGSVFVSNAYDNTVSVIDGNRNVRMATFTVGSNPFGLAVDTGLGRAFVANRSSNTVSVVADPQ